MLSEMWKMSDHGQNWGWFILSAAAASYTFNSIAGAFYEHRINVHARDPNIPVPTDPMTGDELPNDCVGGDCFREAYYVAAGVALFAVLLALLILPKSKYGKQPKPDRINSVDGGPMSNKVSQRYVSEDTQLDERWKTNLIKI